MDITIKTTPQALFALEELLGQDWFPEPGRTTVSYGEDGRIVVMTEHWEAYTIYSDGVVDRFIITMDSTQRIIL